MGIRWTVLCIMAGFVFIGGTGLHAQVPPYSSPLPPEVEAELYNQACGLFFPEELPEGSPYIPRQAVCGTPVVMALAKHWPRLSKATQARFASLFQRPVMPRSIVSEGGHFRIHYTTAGRDSVHSTDSDRNGIPDFVDETARTFEAVWAVEIDGLGYLEPISDGDGLFDVYIRELGTIGTYGLNYPDELGSLTTSSYMEIDNNFTDPIYATRGLAGLRATAAHEFHHSSQFAYYAVDLTWWHEVTATWMEDVVYDDINDYYQYIPSFFGGPTISLDRQFDLTDAHQYGASVYAHYLEQIYGRTSIRRVWEQLKERRAFFYQIEDLDAAMPAGGFARILPGFVVWNYFTGSRARVGLYKEATNYPTARTRLVSPVANLIVSGTGSVDHLASDYVQVVTQGRTGALRGSFTLEEGGGWEFLALLVKESGVEVLRPQGSRLDVPQVGNYDEVVFIPISGALKGVGYDYDYTITLVGSADGQTKPLGLTVNGVANPTVVLKDTARATVRASASAAGEQVTWSVARTSGDLAISVVGQADPASFQTASGAIEIVAGGAGRATVEVAALSSGSTRSLAWIVFNMAVPQNAAPAFRPIGAQAASEGVALSFKVEATDPDGDALSLSASNLPRGASFEGDTFSWTPGFDQGGQTYEVVFTASDGKEQVALTVRVEVAHVDRPAAIRSFSPGRAVVLGVPGDTLRFSVVAEDPDGDPVSYAWTVNGVAQDVAGPALLLVVAAGTAEDTVSVSVQGSGAPAVQMWTVGRALVGDFNADGRVNFADFVTFAAGYGRRAGNPNFDARLDLNGSGVVDFADFLIFARYFGLP